MLCQPVFRDISSVALSGSEKQSNGIDKILPGFPGFHVLTVLERDVEARTFILAHFPKHNPSVVHADFDGDGRLDLAVLLRDNKSGIVKFVILLCPQMGDCKKAHDEEITSYDGGGYIRPIPAGQRGSQTEAVESKDDFSPARLRSIGIEVTYFGQGKVVYYWNATHKKFKTIQTED